MQPLKARVLVQPRGFAPAVLCGLFLSLSSGATCQEPGAPAGPATPETTKPQGSQGAQGSQGPQGAQKSETSATDASGSSEAGKPQEAVGEQAEVFAQVEASGLVVRAYPNLSVPGFPTEGGKGDVYWIAGVAEGEFLPVRVPGGVLGYVHERFAEVGDDGAVTLTRSDVAFRHEPKAGVVPVARVDQGAELWIVAREGDGWMLVRQPNRVAYVPIRSVTRHPSDTTMKASAADLEARNVQRTTDYLRAIEERAQLAALRQKHVEEARELESAVRTESQKPSLEQNWTALSKSIADMIDATEEDEPARPMVQRLARNVEQYSAQAELDRTVSAARAEHEQKRDRAAAVLRRSSTKKNPFADYESGWLRVEDNWFGETAYWLEKGDQKLFRLTCTSGRYLLGDFADREVLIRRNGIQVPTGESRTLDLTGSRAILIVGR